MQQLLLRRLPSLQKLRVQTMERGTPSSALGAIGTLFHTASAHFCDLQFVVEVIMLKLRLSAAGSLDQPLQGGLPRLQSLVAEDCPLLLAHELCTFAKGVCFYVFARTRVCVHFSLKMFACSLMNHHGARYGLAECPQLQEFHVIKCPAFALSEMNAELGFYPDSLTSLVLQVICSFHVA